MATTFIRHRATRLQAVRFINHPKDSEIPGWEVAVDRLIGQLVCAFFVAMAAMWVVATITGIFA
ncbi:MAG TPA: hypothetical protein VGR40_11790 [Candidatus Binatus sp.]|nr:hypothetical protein [Candidatus Binatus sp.]